ncbi:MAG: prolyl-tRNA synthetase associated domain-containing protein [Desulfomonilia bacterium]|jgi:Ala-tRNA(Pro) deacylase|uniref:Prolyl-tRNA editing protein ProX n=1 Tax=anaerobic digester metagenome TaxID=1263854 RepID=A0A485M5U7_9ZZZZ|nr:prolyl-tRNA synthetase associated domain-containing protein [Pseudomonadota bacterium]HON37176.1 prolyl-tRNA synthetase associated domain-containing protein [Deltaproteobacteria bacterium]HRS54962.1 prolyl-tRNA synthetase associated domain-containing protein [Desulfomonilia bacterium]HPD20066.1 prolyl-tRNA synthetase associated domain-containing protein [Deltaproteobacteria bacterium]HPX17785.1 prolyl-tRNA synthetase associated domain-containing protein [Deltaproteobacteria bacterium]
MDIYEFLHTHKIPYERYDHEAVFTCEQADLLSIPSSAAKTKNLFLRDRKGRRHFLVTVGAEKSVDIKAMEGLLSVKGLSFASEERLMQYLGLTPGSVTILAVLNDPDHRVEVIVDEDLWQCQSMQCHPLVNTSTLIMAVDDIRRFLAITGHEARVMRIPVRR